MLCTYKTANNKSKIIAVYYNGAASIIIQLLKQLSKIHVVKIQNLFLKVHRCLEVFMY